MDLEAVKRVRICQIPYIYLQPGLWQYDIWAFQARRQRKMANMLIWRMELTKVTYWMNFVHHVISFLLDI